MTVKPKSTLPAPGAGGSAAADRGEPADPEPRRTARPSIVVDLVEDDGDWSALGTADALAALAQEAADHVAAASELSEFLPRPPTAGEAVVALSSDAAVAELNARYRGKAKPTNVLSFPASADTAPAAPGLRPLGDIVLAAETVAAEAADLGIEPADHLRHLIVHGLLHLLGFDHIEVDEAEEMEGLETRILATLGVADPYAGRELSDAPT